MDAPVHSFCIKTLTTLRQKQQAWWLLIRHWTQKLLNHKYAWFFAAQLECAMASFFCEGPCLEEGILAQFMPKVVNLARR